MKSEWLPRLVSPMFGFTNATTKMLQAKKEHQRKHISTLLCGEFVVSEIGVTAAKSEFITFDTMEAIVDYFHTLDKKDDLFEECWKEYRRKGVKKKAKEYWAKLKDNEKPLVLPHIKAYVSSRAICYQKDFERYLRDKVFNSIVFYNNNIVYDPQKTINKEEYTPHGHSIYKDYDRNVYVYTGLFFSETDTVYDGYKDDERPDKAFLMLNNGRGSIVWLKEQNKWGLV